MDMITIRICINQAPLRGKCESGRIVVAGQPARLAAAHQVPVIEPTLPQLAGSRRRWGAEVRRTVIDSFMGGP